MSPHLKIFLSVCLTDGMIETFLCNMIIIIFIFVVLYESSLQSALKKIQEIKNKNALENTKKKKLKTMMVCQK